MAFGLGGLGLVPVLAIGDAGPLFSGGGLALALFLGTVPTALAYVLFARGLRRLSAAETSTLTLAEPLTAGLLGAVVLGERLTTLSGVGAALVLAGLLVLAARAPLPRRRRVAVEPA
jgi:DME family drug/metabolite transporter